MIIGGLTVSTVSVPGVCDDVRQKIYNPKIPDLVHVVKMARSVPGPPESRAVVVAELSSELQRPAGAGYAVGRC